MMSQCSSAVFVAQAALAPAMRDSAATSNIVSAQALAISFSTSPVGSSRISRSQSPMRSEEHTSELQSLMRISYAVFCLKKKITHNHKIKHISRMQTLNTKHQQHHYL